MSINKHARCFTSKRNSLIFVEEKICFRILVTMLKMTNKLSSTTLNISFMKINSKEDTKQCNNHNEKYDQKLLLHD